MKLSKSFIILLLFILFHNACNKGPFWTNAEGKVIDSQNSKPIQESTVSILTWDGNKKNDTIIIYQIKCDSLGYFNFDFDVESSADFFFLKAKKEGYDNSGLIQIDGGSTNYHKIHLHKTMIIDSLKN